MKFAQGLVKRIPRRQHLDDMRYGVFIHLEDLQHFRCARPGIFGKKKMVKYKIANINST